jgi:hypothetical protein
MQRAKHVFLRIERSGNQFTGHASVDGVTWIGCGTTNVGMGNPVFVGLHALAPGNIPATLTRFDYFRIFRRQREAGAGRYQMGMMQQPVAGATTQVAAMSPLQRSQTELRRFLGMRQLM